MTEQKQGRRFAIGDIHGCKTTFKKLLKKIELQPSDSLYILGDMIDRGRSSAGVLDIIIKLKEEAYNIFPIRGNHEQMLIDILNTNPEKIHSYLRYFKSEDLLGFKGDVKKKYFNLVSSLPYYIELPDFILVHASLDLNDENFLQEIDFILYSKYHRGNTVYLKNKKLVHGHMVLDLNVIQKSIDDNSKIIGIDNGCIYGKGKKGFGNLVCLNLDTMQIITQKFSD